MVTDLVEVYEKFQFWGHGLYISGLKHARKLNFGMSVLILGINTIYEYCHA